MSRSDQRAYDDARSNLDAMFDRIVALESELNERDEKIKELEEKLDNISFSM